MWRSKYRASFGNYYIYKSDRINAVAKTVGADKEEQRIIANQIVQALNAKLKTKPSCEVCNDTGWYKKADGCYEHKCDCS